MATEILRLCSRRRRGPGSPHHYGPFGQTIWCPRGAGPVRRGTTSSLDPAGDPLPTASGSPMHPRAPPEGIHLRVALNQETIPHRDELSPAAVIIYDASGGPIAWASSTLAALTAGECSPRHKAAGAGPSMPVSSGDPVLLNCLLSPCWPSSKRPLRTRETT